MYLHCRDEESWTLGSERVLISKPELEWERHYINETGWNPPHKVFVNEGPQPLKSPRVNIFTLLIRQAVYGLRIMPWAC